MSSYSISKMGKFPNRFQGRPKKKQKAGKKKGKTEILANQDYLDQLAWVLMLKKAKAQILANEDDLDQISLGSYL